MIPTQQLQTDHATRLSILSLHCSLNSISQLNRKIYSISSEIHENSQPIAELKILIEERKVIRETTIKSIIKSMEQGNIDTCLVDAENLPLIFEIHYLFFRNLGIEKNSKMKSLDKFHLQTVVKWLNEAKLFVKSSNARTKNIAAQVGEVTSAYYSYVFSNNTVNHVLLSHPYNNDVFLFPSFQLALKLGNMRNRLEERLVNDISVFYCDNFIKSVEISPSLEEASKFNLFAPDENERRKISINGLSKNVWVHIWSSLPNLDRIIIRNALGGFDLDFEILEKLQKAKFKVTPLKGYEETFSFYELQFECWQGKIEDNALVEIVDADDSISFYIPPNTRFNYIKKKTHGLYPYLNYMEIGKSLNFFMVPAFSSEKEQAIYEKCESCSWSYKKERKEVSAKFSQIHRLYLEGELLIEDLTSTSSIKMSREELEQALEVPWKLISNKQLVFKSKSVLAQIQDFQVKPFIEELILLSQLDKYPTAKKFILKNMTAESEFSAFMTGLLQFLDLHADNIGLKLDLKGAHLDYMNVVFFVYSSKGACTLKFSELVIEYHAGHISDHETVFFKKSGEIFSNEIGNLTDLKLALYSKWKLVFFDTELSLAENNKWRYEKNGLHMPFRSGFLCSSWRNYPLQPATLKLLEESEEAEKKMWAWIRKSEAPIRQHLSARVNAQIDTLIHDRVIQYKLSTDDGSYNHTINELQYDFVGDISDFESNENLWKLIHEHYKKKIDLTSVSSEAQKQREFIAGQLFPRLTIDQQNALNERFIRMRKFLKDYKELSLCELEGQDVLNYLREYIDQPETCLSTITYRAFKTRIDELLKNSSVDSKAVFKLYIKILKTCRPTYFNLMKVMYPHLADVYALIKKVIHQINYITPEDKKCSDEQLIGEAIGFWRTSVTEILTLIKKKYPSSSIFYEIATQLEQSKSEKPSFFSLI